MKGRIGCIPVCIACLMLLFSLTAYGDNRSQGMEETNIENADDAGEQTGMKLYINDIKIPVFWEDNDTVAALAEQAEAGDILVSMSMYSDNEQVGSLGRPYIRRDQQTTTHNGDIVLYNGDHIVVFYGSNSWSYTRVGKMDLSESEVIELLSSGDVELKISIQ